MSKGIIIFAQNNEYVDYAQQACACAGYARKNLSLFDEDMSSNKYRNFRIK